MLSIVASHQDRVGRIALVQVAVVVVGLVHQIITTGGIVQEGLQRIIGHHVAWLELRQLNLTCHI